MTPSHKSKHSDPQKAKAHSDLDRAKQGLKAILDDKTKPVIVATYRDPLGNECHTLGFVKKQSGSSRFYARREQYKALKREKERQLAEQEKVMEPEEAVEGPQEGQIG